MVRSSTRVIWFREDSPKEGDRIVTWYKLECGLGLSSGLTEIYSSRSPCAPLAHLDVRYNRIGHEGTKRLAAVPTECTTLECLSAHGDLDE